MMISPQHHIHISNEQYEAGRSRNCTEDNDAPPATTIGRADDSILHTVCEGIMHNVSPVRHMDSVNAANDALGNRAFLQLVDKLRAQRNHPDEHHISTGGIQVPGRPLTYTDTREQAFNRHNFNGMPESTEPEAQAPLQLVTKRMQNLVPQAFRFTRLTAGPAHVKSAFQYKNPEINTLISNYRQGGIPQTGFSRPVSALNRLAIAHLSGEDLNLLARAYRKSYWLDPKNISRQRPSLQHLGQLLDESSARIAGGRFLRYTAADIKGLSQGDKVIVPTFNPAELIQSPRMFGLPFDFCSHGTQFSMRTDSTNMVIIELIMPDKHKLALSYGTMDDAEHAYAPHLIHPWVYTVDKVSVVGSGFPEARNAIKFVEQEHAFIRFIKLRALQYLDLLKMIKTDSPARNLYTGRNISSQYLVGVYQHLYRYRKSEDMPPIGE